MRIRRFACARPALLTLKHQFAKQGSDYRTEYSNAAAYQFPFSEHRYAGYVAIQLTIGNGTVMNNPMNKEMITEYANASFMRFSLLFLSNDKAFTIYGEHAFQ